ALTFATVGLVISRAQPRNTIGWLFAGVGLIVGFYLAAERYQYFALVVHHGDLPLGTLAAWLQAWTYVPALAIVVNVLPQVFPTGRPVTPRWRFGLWLTVLSFLGIWSTDALVPGVIDQSVVQNPVALSPEAYHLVSGVGLAVYVATTILAVVSLVVRWRRADRRLRQQLKLFTYAAALLPVFVVASGIVNQSGASGPWAPIGSFVLATVAFLGLPIATAVSILRHRLYDIDLVINRTLVYAALTTSLVATYLVSVLVFRLALDPVTGRSDLAVAASTLGVAALFRPLRARIQAGVDRRFYRSRYDAARTLDTFADRLRHEVDLTALGTDLQAVVVHTMQPEHVSLWLREER
ncbi:MAG: hypothetical protein JOZ82_01465, partial [Marmoricola sp.]|nr:hypothetical protein [Marmoricola sp.]